MWLQKGGGDPAAAAPLCRGCRTPAPARPRLPTPQVPGQPLPPRGSDARGRCSFPAAPLDVAAEGARPLRPVSSRRDDSHPSAGLA